MPGTSAIRRILIVDDEPSIAKTLGMIFTDRGYEARVACSAEAALDIIAAWQPDTAIVDVMLPQMNGLDFAILLKDKYPDCNVVLFSGQPDTSALLDEGISKGHRFDILAKPLHPTTILEKIESFFTSASSALAEPEAETP